MKKKTLAYSAMVVISLFGLGWTMAVNRNYFSYRADSNQNNHPPLATTTQIGFSGGPSTEIANILWNDINNNHWNKYQSLKDVQLTGENSVDFSGTSSEFVSSIYQAPGNTTFDEVLIYDSLLGGVPGLRAKIRIGPTPDTLSDWIYGSGLPGEDAKGIGMSPSSVHCIQLKVITQINQPVHINLGFSFSVTKYIYKGKITDASSNGPVEGRGFAGGVTINASCTSVVAYGDFSVTCPYESVPSLSFTFTRPGYITKTISIPHDSFALNVGRILYEYDADVALTPADVGSGDNSGDTLSSPSDSNSKNSNNSNSQLSIKRIVTSSNSNPKAPVLSLTAKVKINSQNVPEDITADTTATNIIPTQKLTFSGTTSPNTKVTLTIHSAPITKEITSDVSGNWAYTLDPKELALETGDHAVTAIATDIDGNKSDPITLATFTLNPDPSQIKALAPEKFTWRSLLNVQNYILGGVLVVLIGSLTLLIAKRHKRSSIPTSNV